MGAWVLMSLLWTGLTQNSSRAGAAALWEQTAQEGLEMVLCCFLCTLRPCKEFAPLQLRVYSRLPIPGSFQDQIIQGLQQPGIVEGPCAHGRRSKEMMFKVPSNPKCFLFYDSFGVCEFVPQPVPGTTPVSLQSCMDLIQSYQHLQTILSSFLLIYFF